MRLSRKRKKRRAHCILGGPNPVGYCRLHKVTITLRQMRNRECLNKQCGWLKKHADHEFWKQREAKKKGATETHEQS